jgi:hypothetical protein
LTTSGSVEASGVARGTVGDAVCSFSLRDRDAGVIIDRAFKAGASDDRKVSRAGGNCNVTVGLRDASRTAAERLTSDAAVSTLTFAERDGRHPDRQDRWLAPRKPDLSLAHPETSKWTGGARRTHLWGHEPPHVVWDLRGYQGDVGLEALDGARRLHR